jgi:hypothetical protein
MNVEFGSEGGALILCQMIERAWQKAGYPEVEAEAAMAEFGEDNKGRHYWTVKIRGLLNGLPIPRDRR